MRRSLLLLACIATPAMAQQQQSAANVGVSAAGAHWLTVHNYVLRAAEQVPDSLFGFKPTPEIRSLGEQINHIATAEGMFCSMVLGEQSPIKNATTKADLVQSLKNAGMICERAYAMSDAAASEMINVFGQQRTKQYALTMNAIHDWEHYGNIVTYMRLKGLVPPSSQR